MWRHSAVWIESLQSNLVWYVASCPLVNRYRCFGRAYCFHIQDQAALHGSLTTWHVVTSQKTWNFNNTAVLNWNLAAEFVPCQGALILWHRIDWYTVPAFWKNVLRSSSDKNSVMFTVTALRISKLTRKQYGCVHVLCSSSSWGGGGQTLSDFAKTTPYYLLRIFCEVEYTKRLFGMNSW
jgi:hypothetical protein